jgi:hypothetical protein
VVGSGAGARGGLEWTRDDLAAWLRIAASDLVKVSVCVVALVELAAGL